MIHTDLENLKLGDKVIVEIDQEDIREFGGFDELLKVGQRILFTVDTLPQHDSTYDSIVVGIHSDDWYHDWFYPLHKLVVPEIEDLL